MDKGGRVSVLYAKVYSVVSYQCLFCFPYDFEMLSALVHSSALEPKFQMLDPVK